MMEFAIVDIETTGGFAGGNGITEISIQVHDGQRKVSEYNTLVNPGQPIPYYIQGLTGISNAMVAKAPSFQEVAEQIYSILRDRVFVAHNVNFDYSFVKHELALSGYTLQAQKLCTVRLSRRIFPGLPSYSLGNICGYLGITIKDRHRAAGDAIATTRLFELLLENDKEELIRKFIKRHSKERILSPNMPVSQFDKLPETPGVYYFHDQKGKPVYVGKAINIKKRVASHFSNNGTGEQKQEFLRSIYSVSCEECGNELMALILESHQIKHLWPKFNRSQKRFEATYGVLQYFDQRGFKRLCIEKIKKNIHPLATFGNLAQGYDWLRRVVNDYDLCLRLTGIATDTEQCAERNCACLSAVEEEMTDYNRRVDEALGELTANRSFVITEDGRHDDELALVVVENGTFSKMGFVPLNNFSKQGLQEVLPQLPAYKENFTIRQIIFGYSADHPEKLVYY